jgi:hypothetical protein
MNVCLSTVLVCVACGEKADLALNPGTSQTQPIIGGVPSTASDYRSVGVLIGHGTRSGVPTIEMICTGTLVARDVVLLAGHCTDPELVFDPNTSYSYTWSFQLDVTDLGVSTLEPPADAIPVVHMVAHPGYASDSFDPANAVPGLSTYDDIALAVLAEPVFGRAPAVVLRASDASDVAVGKAVHIVGYGQRGTDPWDYGVKHQALSIINETGATEMQIGDVSPTPQKCYGDSGGPTFLDYYDGFLPVMRVIGVTSHAYDETECAKGGVDTRIDAYRAWVNNEMIDLCKTHVRAYCGGGGGLAEPVLATSPYCGDGQTNGFEACDRDDLDGETCVSGGFSDGTLACTSTCGFDTSGCIGTGPVCGDGTSEGLEQCDGEDFGSNSCVGFGFTGGTLACTAGCVIDVSRCTRQSQTPYRRPPDAGCAASGSPLAPSCALLLLVLRRRRRA